MSRPDWAWTKDLGFDAEGYQRKEACLGIASCPTCGADVELIADTESQTLEDDGRWHHEDYGPACGECCGNLIVDSFEGCRVFRLDGSDPDDAERDDDESGYGEDD